MDTNSVFAEFKQSFGNEGIAIILVVANPEDGELHAISAHRFCLNDKHDANLKRSIYLTVKDWLREFAEDEAISAA